MRLALKLKSNKKAEQNKENNSKYHSAMHGWIYGKLENTAFSDLHSSRGFKLFCFSNLFPIENATIEENKIYTVVISSPSENLMISLLSNVDKDETVNLGEYSFTLVSYKPLPKKEISDLSHMESETVLNVCLPIEKNSLGKKAITLSEDPENFKTQLAKNSIRKYNDHSSEKVDENFDLWKNIEVEEIQNSKKAVKINFVKDNDNWFDVIGSRYRFKLGKLDETQRKILQLCYDLGFGERNSFGFGFMNIKKEVRED